MDADAVVYGLYQTIKATFAEEAESGRVTPVTVDKHCLQLKDLRVCGARKTTLEGGKTREHFCLKDSDHPEERHVCSCYWVWTKGATL